MFSCKKFRKRFRGEKKVIQLMQLITSWFLWKAMLICVWKRSRRFIKLGSTSFQDKRCVFLDRILSQNAQRSRKSKTAPKHEFSWKFRKSRMLE